MFFIGEASARMLAESDMMQRGRTCLKLLLALGCASASVLSAQESRTVTDNDQVKVLKVVVQPHQKTRMHQHVVNRVMIYLQPGRQDLKYQDGKKLVLDWKSGDAKWSAASGMHIAEITSDNPVTIVEIELKNPAGAGKLAKNDFDPVKLDPKHYAVDFENDQVRVLRVKMGPHESAPMHEHALNRVVVYLTDQKIRVTSADGKQEQIEHNAGDVGWGAPARHREENIGGQAFELYAVELKN